MSKITSVTIQPGTPGEIQFRVGEETRYKSGKEINKIEFDINESVSEVVIYANEKIYADYVNVPCVLYFDE